MTARTRFILAAAVLGLLMTGPFLLTAFLILQETQGDDRRALINIRAPRLPIGTILTLLGFAGGIVLLRELFRHYVRGLHAMGEQMRLMLGANRDFRIALQGPPEEIRNNAELVRLLAP